MAQSAEERREYLKAYREANRELERERKRAWSEANLERKKERDRAYYLTHRDEILANVKAYREANREKVQAYQKQRHKDHPRLAIDRAKSWYRTNRERKRAYDQAHSREYRDANREKVYAAGHRRRARKKAAPGRGWTAADVAAQYKAQRGKCFYCRCRLGKRFHRDHIIPLARGGAHCRSNLALACAPCNLSKNARNPQEFAGILL